MMFGLIVGVAVVAAPPPEPKCTSIGPKAAPVLRYICASERGWAESVATGDPTTVKRILADDFIGVDPKGELYRKSEMVADTIRASQYFTSNEIGDIVVRFYGNMAVAQGSETWTKKSGTKGRWVWTDTWLKRRGQWQVVAAEDLEAPAK